MTGKSANVQAESAIILSTKEAPPTVVEHLGGMAAELVKGLSSVTNDSPSPIVNQSPTPLQQQRVELAAQIIHRRTTIIGDRWDRLHPTQQSWYRDMARELLKDVDALMNGGA